MREGVDAVYGMVWNVGSTTHLAGHSSFWLGEDPYILRT